MPATTIWLLPFLLVLFCLILAALAAQTVYVACYRRRFHRATSTAPPSTTSDCERGLLFSPAWSRCEGGAPSQELLLYQLCVKEHDGWKSTDAQRTRAGPAGADTAAAAPISKDSRPKATRKKVQYASETRNSGDAASIAGLKEEGEKSQAVTRFREKYAARFLSPIREAPAQSEDDSNNGARTYPAEVEDVNGAKAKEGDEEEEPDSFYTPPQSPPWRGSRTTASAYDDQQKQWPRL